MSQKKFEICFDKYYDCKNGKLKFDRLSQRSKIEILKDEHLIIDKNVNAINLTIIFGIKHNFSNIFEYILTNNDVELQSIEDVKFFIENSIYINILYTDKYNMNVCKSFLTTEYFKKNSKLIITVC